MWPEPSTVTPSATVQVPALITCEPALNTFLTGDDMLVIHQTVCVGACHTVDGHLTTVIHVNVGSHVALEGDFCASADIHGDARGLLVVEAADERQVGTGKYIECNSGASVSGVDEVHHLLASDIDVGITFPEVDVLHGFLLVEHITLTNRFRPGTTIHVVVALGINFAGQSGFIVIVGSRVREIPSRLSRILWGTVYPCTR